MLDKNLLGTHAIAVPYSPNDLRLGVEDKAKYFFDKKVSRVLLEGKSKIYKLSNKYLTSYTNANQFTVRVYRDMLMSYALTMSARCMQTRDTAYTHLTVHAKRYWKNKGNSFWDNAPTYANLDNDPLKGLYGLAGSPAFYMYLKQHNSNGLFPFDFLTQTLDYALDEIDCTSLNTANECQSKYFEKINLYNLPIENYKFALDDISKHGADTQYLPVLKLIRNNLLQNTDWDNLKQRLVLGEYVDSLYTVLEALAVLADTDEMFRERYSFLSSINMYPKSSVNTHLENLQLYKENSLTTFAPAGPALFYQLMALKGIVDAVEVLETLDDSIFDQDITFLLRESNNNSKWLTGAAEYIATSYDAMGALGLYKTTYEAKGLAYRFFLTALQLIRWLETPFISEQGNSRLYELIS